MKIKTAYIFLILGVSFSFVSCKGNFSLNPNKNPRNFFKDKGVLELIEASTRGDIEKIDELVSRGVDVNAIGEQGVTPLAWTAFKNKEGFKRLLEHGADPNYLSVSRNTVMTIAVVAKDPYYLKTALEHSGDPNAIDPGMNENIIFESIGNLRMENMKLLIEHGADMNARDKYLKTPMMAAATLNRFDFVYALLEAGADYSLKDNMGYTIVYYIKTSTENPTHELHQWRAKVIEFLKKKGVEVNLDQNP